MGEKIRVSEKVALILTTWLCMKLTERQNNIMQTKFINRVDSLFLILILLAEYMKYNKYDLEYKNKIISRKFLAL